MDATVDLDILYDILRRFARDGEPRTYGELSAAYRGRTGMYLPPHVAWNLPLDTINKRLDAAGLPPLSAFVVNQDTRMPGRGFWGACSRTQGVFSNDDERMTAYVAILQEACAADWPPTPP